MASRFVVAWLGSAGVVLAVAGAVGIVAGTFFAAWLHDQLPPVLIDAAAVGGAATATGVALAGLAGLHLVAAVLLGRGLRAAHSPAAVLAATMLLLCIGWGVAALVSAASGAGPASELVPAGIGLGLVAIGYAWTARALIGLRQPPETSI